MLTMKKLLFLASLILGLGISAHAQGQITAATTTAGCSQSSPSAGAVDLAFIAGTGSMGVSVTGTWTATLQLQVSTDHGKTWTAAATPFTTNQQSIISVAGYSDVCVFASAYTSGTAIVTFSPSTSPSLASSSGDPCANPNIVKSSAFANITTATTTALVAVSGTTSVYVCYVIVELNSTVSASTVLFEQGTGAACAGAPTALTATYANSTTNLNTVIPIGNGAATAIKTSAANGFCAVSTVGTTPTTPVTIIFVQM
jgi:hypothetical protein